MQAHNNVKRVFNGVIARLVPVAARLRLADWVDALVAGWLKRCAANAEAAQRLFIFSADRNAVDDGFDVGPAASSVSHP